MNPKSSIAAAVLVVLALPALADVIPTKRAAPPPVVAKPAKDAMLASVPANEKVLVGVEAEDLDALAKAIEEDVAAAKDRKGHPRVVIYAETTTDYGCDCPPFVFAPFYNSGRTESYFLPQYAKGVPDAPLSKVGLYRFAGHFDGRRITGFDWLKARGKKLSKDEKEGMDEYARKAPVFVVDGWCFEPADSFEDEAQREIYEKTLVKMAKEGRFCADTTFPGAAED